MALPSRSRRLLAALLLAGATWQCGGGETPGPRPGPSPSPAPAPSEPAIPVNGSERVGWTQGAEDLAALKALQFAAYVDSTRTTLSGWTCAETRGSSGFDCSAPLPAMSRGRHSLSVVALGSSGEARSESLLLDVGGSALMQPATPAEESASASGSARPRNGTPTRFSAWARIRSASAILASATPSHAFVVSGEGQLMVATPTAIAPMNVPPTAANASIVDVAVSRRFTSTRVLFLAWREAGDGARNDELSVVRYRDVGNTLGESARVIDGIPLPGRGSVRLRVGPDEKLYVAVSDAASDASTIFRFNQDGTTPRAHGNASPVFAVADSRITDLAWHPQTGELWSVGTSDGRRVLTVFDAAERADMGALPLRGARPVPSLPDSAERMGVGDASIAFAVEAAAERVTLLFADSGSSHVIGVAVSGRRLEPLNTDAWALPGPPTALAGTASPQMIFLVREGNGTVIGSLNATPNSRRP